MSVLSGDEIKRLINEGKLGITPFTESQVGPASVDLRLGDLFRVFNKTRDIFQVTDSSDYSNITRMIHVKEGDSLLVMPGELVNGITFEKISLPDDICGRVEGRSRFARIGLLTHISSSFLQPGVSNKIVLEIANLSPTPLALHPGTRICQIVLEELKGKGRYKGKFSTQTKP